MESRKSPRVEDGEVEEQIRWQKVGAVRYAVGGDMKLCTSCARANRDCPSFPSPVGECKQYVKHPEAKRWWESLKERGVIEGD